MQSLARISRQILGFDSIVALAAASLMAITRGLLSLARKG
jgi:hypothetical protein